MPFYMLCLHPDKLLKPFIISWFSRGPCRVLMYGIILPASHNASISFFCLSSLAFPPSSVSSFRVLVRMIDLLSVQLFSVMERVCESFSADFDPPRSSSSNAVHIFRALSQYQSVMFQHMTQLGFTDSVLHRDSGVAEPPGAREVFGMESCFPGVAAITKYPKKEKSPGFSYCCPGVAIPCLFGMSVFLETGLPYTIIHHLRLHVFVSEPCENS